MLPGGAHVYACAARVWARDGGVGEAEAGMGSQGNEQPLYVNVPIDIAISTARARSLTGGGGRYEVRMALISLDNAPAWFAGQAADHLSAEEARSLAATDGSPPALCIPDLLPY